MHAVPFDPSVHFVRETPFASYLRGHLRDPLLFTYYHGKTENWLVAAWVDERKERLLELAVLGKTWAGTRDVVKSIETMVLTNPEGMKNRKENIRLAKTAMKHWDNEELEEAQETAGAMEFLQRKAKHGQKHFVVNG